MHTGTVKRFNKIKGYGFITPDNESEKNEIFVHFSQIQMDGYRELQEGQRIRYTLEKNERGEFATNVVIL